MMHPPRRRPRVDKIDLLLLLLSGLGTVFAVVLVMMGDIW